MTVGKKFKKLHIVKLRRLVLKLECGKGTGVVSCGRIQIDAAR